MVGGQRLGHLRPGRRRWRLIPALLRQHRHRGLPLHRQHGGRRVQCRSRPGFLLPQVSLQLRATARRLVLRLRRARRRPHQSPFYFRTDVSSLAALRLTPSAAARSTTTSPPASERRCSAAVFSSRSPWLGTPASAGCTSTTSRIPPANYLKSTPSRSPGARFTVGAYEYLQFGRYHVLDNLVDELTVLGPAIAQ